MSIPVVIAENGFGIPVIPVEKNAPPAIVATNGYGIPIVIVEKNGQPMIIEGLFSPASLFANGEAGDAWVAEREWCYTKTLGGVYEPATTSGDLCARWKGMAKGINADQDVIGKRPVYVEGGGLSWLEFDGVDDALVTPSIDFTGTDKMSLFSGVRKETDVGVRILYELSTSTNTNDGTFLNAPGYAGFGSEVGAYFGGAAKGTVLQSAVSPPSYPAPATAVQTHLIELGADYNVFRVNGAQVASNTSDLGAGSFGNFPFYIGSRGGTSLFFQGRIYGIFPRGALSTAPEISAPENYLANLAGKSL